MIEASSSISNPNPASRCSQPAVTHITTENLPVTSLHDPRTDPLGLDMQHIQSMIKSQFELLWTEQLKLTRSVRSYKATKETWDNHLAAGTFPSFLQFKIAVYSQYPQSTPDTTIANWIARDNSLVNHTRVQLLRNCIESYTQILNDLQSRLYSNSQCYIDHLIRYIPDSAPLSIRNSIAVFINTLYTIKLMEESVKMSKTTQSNTATSSNDTMDIIHNNMDSRQDTPNVSVTNDAITIKDLAKQVASLAAQVSSLTKSNSRHFSSGGDGSPPTSAHSTKPYRSRPRSPSPTTTRSTGTRSLHTPNSYRTENPYSPPPRRSSEGRRNAVPHPRK